MNKDFQWAIRMLQCGKKVRRKHWCKSFYIKTNFEGKILECDSQRQLPMKIQTLIGNDWELYEPIKFCPCCGKKI